MPRPLMGQFVVRGQQLRTLLVYTKFEKRSFSRLRNIVSVAKFKIGSRDPGHAYLGAICNL